MAEMIEDGCSGWLAADASPAALAEALRRALSTPAGTRAEMGRAAAARIREICDNERTLAAHLEFRERVRRTGLTRSTWLPGNLPWVGARLDSPAAPPAPLRDPRRVGVAVTCRERGKLLDDCLAAVDALDHAPAATVLVVNDVGDASVTGAAERARTAGWRVEHSAALSAPALRNVALNALLALDPELGAIVFLDQYDRPLPNLLTIATGILHDHPEVALVSPWCSYPDHGIQLNAPPCPALPYQLLVHELTPSTVMRVEPLLRAGPLNEVLPDGFDTWELGSMLLEQGGVAVTVPWLLAERRAAPFSPASAGPAFSRLRTAMLERLADAVRRDALHLVTLLESHSTQISRAGGGAFITPLRALRMPPSEQLRLVRKALRNPRQALRWLTWHGREFASRAWAHVGRRRDARR